MACEARGGGVLWFLSLFGTLVDNTATYIPYFSFQEHGDLVQQEVYLAGTAGAITVRLIEQVVPIDVINAIRKAGLGLTD